MEKLRAIVVDDENDALEILTNLLTDTNLVEVIGQISNALKVESHIHKLQPDVVFIDIEMPGIDGISLIENIRSYNQHLQVVFVTAYDKYMAKAIKLNVFSYLLKPIDRAELAELVQKLLDCRSTQPDDSPIQNHKIRIPVREGYAFLSPQEILLLRADGNYTFIITVEEEIFCSSYNLGKIAEYLPVEQFLRINRAELINSDYLHKIKRKKNICVLRVGAKETELKVSQTFLSQFNKTTKQN